MKRLPFYWRILIAMVAGAGVGLWLGPSTAPLGEVGKVVITMIKTLAAPLLFLSVLDTFLSHSVRLKGAAVMLVVSLTNAAIALVIGLSISSWFNVGAHLRHADASATAAQAAAPAGALQKLDFVKAIAGFVPASIVQPFADNAVIALIGLAILLGLALRKVRRERGEGSTRAVEQGVSAFLRANEVMLAWVIWLVPAAVFAVVARTVGENGFAPFKGLMGYVGVVLLGLAIQVVIVYQAWIYFVSGISLRRFWTGARDAIVYAMGASSSLATLPVTLASLDRMGVSRESSTMAACVGTNLNNDGVLLYEAIAVLFVAQAHGIELTVGQQMLAAASCVLASFGIAGIPDAGLISLSLVLTTVGLPVELLPLLLTVDWVLSRARATTNVISDILVALLVERFAPPVGEARASDGGAG